MSFKQVWRLFKETLKEWQADEASQLAAALAYYTAFSLAPLLVIVIAIAGFFLGEEAAKGELLGQIQGLVGRDGAEVLQTAIENSGRSQNANIWASIISGFLLLLGASGVFAQLQAALNRIWNVEAKPGLGLWGFLRKRFLSLAMILVIGFLLLTSLVLSAVLAALGGYLNQLFPEADILLGFLNFIVSFGVITLLFAMIYKFLPDVKIGWNDVWFGAAITAFLFTIGKFLIGLYLGNSSIGSTYGAAGSLVVILAWVYYSVQILFFGAEFTQVFARKYGSQIEPDDHAVWIGGDRSSTR